MLKKWIVAAVVISALLVAAKLLFFVERPKAAVPRPGVIDVKRKSFLASQQRSQALVERGIASLRNRDVNAALTDFMESISVFPPNTQAYMMIVKVYLSMRQEGRMYEALERAGRSYPLFDKILDVIDDDELSRIPLPVEPLDVHIAPFKDNKKAAVSFMFDDGEANVYTGVLPLFDKYAFKATVPVIAGQAGTATPNRGSWAEWRDAASRGFEIANHSMNHHDLRTLTPASYKVEIDDAKDLIEKETGQKVRSFVFPLDGYADGSLAYVLRTHAVARQPDLLRRYYDRTLTIVYGGPRFPLATANRLIDIAVARRLWVVAESHGLDQRGADHYKPMSVDFLDKHLAYISSRAQDIWVDTFYNVFEYLALRKDATVERKDVTPTLADVVVHCHSDGKVLPQPLTVVLGVAEAAPRGVSARSPGGAALRSWPCAEKSVCVEVNVCETPVNVSWDGNK